MKLIKVTDYYKDPNSPVPEYSQIWLDDELVFEGPQQLDFDSPFDCESVLMGITKTLFFLGEEYDLETDGKFIKEE